MGITEILQLILGLVLFLYGMDSMGDALKKSAGNRLKLILGKMTSSPLRGFLLGLGVTLIIQSSSATTVMVVGFVNSGTMTLLQSVGVIMGANVGTAITAWLTALSGIEEAGDALSILKWLKPDSWIPFVALIGIGFIMFSKRSKKKDLGAILIGFTVLMVGMSIMSESVGGLKDNEAFKNILVMFENPILGVLAGLVLTAIVQSSSASVGILQSLTTTGAITYGAAIPIIMGQNIGTCVTALISSISANKNGKRAAIIHLYFNIIGVVVWLSLFYLFNFLFEFAFVSLAIDMWGVALVHTVFKILSVMLIAPFSKWLEKLSKITISDKTSDGEHTSLLDERLFETPAIAIARAEDLTFTMAKTSIDALRKSFTLLDNYDARVADEIREIEERVDKYEDALGSYLVKASARDMDEGEAVQITKLLHIIGDLERLSDHAVNFVESAEELRDKRITFSAQAISELGVLRSAVTDILNEAYEAFVNGNMTAAANVEPIEEVVDELRDKIKLNHIIRLQKSECTIEHGFVLSDLLTNFERVSDHCSNIASCVVEIAQHDALEMHKYQSELKHQNKSFEEKYAMYKEKYSV